MDNASLARQKRIGQIASYAGLILVVLVVQLIPFLSLLIPLFLMLQSADLTNSLIGVSITYLVLIQMTRMTVQPAEIVPHGSADATGEPDRADVVY